VQIVEKERIKSVGESKMGVGKGLDEAFEKCGNVGLLSTKVASSRKIDDITAKEFRHCLRQLDNILAT